MFWNVTFIYNAFIRTTDHCKVQTVFVSLFYIFITTRAFNEFLYEFLRIFVISENSLKFANFFAEVMNSRSMLYIMSELRGPLRRNVGDQQ